MRFLDITYEDLQKIEVVKNEEVGFLVEIEVDGEFCLNLGDSFDLPWWGLDKRYRLVCEGVELNCVKGDIIHEEEAMNFKDKARVFVSLKTRVAKELEFRLYSSIGYEEEVLIEKKKLNIEVLDFGLEEEDEVFFLDLWQHPCSWARAHGVKYFSEEHFEVIENYLRGMKKLGQKVIGLVVSDFPWAGQKCFKIEENPSRLYEYNIVGVKKKDEELSLDFSNLDRYVELCVEVGIDKEINLFGLICNWDRIDFGSPLEGYKDPIRIRVYDEDRKINTYIRKKEELGEYLRQLFKHLEEKGWMDIVKIMGDEPDKGEYFKEYSSFLQEHSNQKLVFKSAIHGTDFFKEYEGDLDSFSVNTLVLTDCMEEILGEKSSKMTWYSCCFPDQFNVFLDSPLIETRLIGMYTYLWKMKGMLRWAYGIFVEDVYENPRYKPEKWPTGDMFLVYPGKNKNVVHSMREKALMYAVQDFNILKKLEKENPNLYEEFKSELKINSLGKRKGDDLVLEEYPSYSRYMEIRNAMIKKTRIVWTKDLESKEYEEILELRKEVFVKELNSPIELEISDEDKCKHIGIFEGEEIVAAGRILKKENSYQLQRIATRKDKRKKGYGRRLIKEMEEKAGGRIEICASEKALDFYKELGYKVEKRAETRAGIEHFMVFKEIH